MPSLNYNLSPTLRRQLETIDELRQQILSIPLSPLQEHRLRWQAINSRISAWQLLSGKKNTANDIWRQHQAINHVYFKWSANSQIVAISSLDDVADILRRNLPTTEQNLKPVLGFVQQGSNSAVIQAAIIHLHMSPDILSHLAALMFLSRQGYDVRGLVAIEAFWTEHPAEYKEMLVKSAKLANITLWIEYYCQALASALEHLKFSLTHETRAALANSDLGKLTERQQSILALLDPANSTVSNKKVQAVFKVSQITASRDLAHLAESGFIIPHGKGRSITYSKV